MAWVRTTLKVGGEEVDGFFRAGPPLEATVPWREDIAVGAAVEVGGARYRVVSLRDPGNRHETLELDLEPQAAKAEPAARKKRKVNAETRDVA